LYNDVLASQTIFFVSGTISLRALVKTIVRINGGDGQQKAHYSDLGWDSAPRHSFDRDSTFGVRRGDRDAEMDTFSSVTLATMECRPLFEVKSVARRESIDPTGAYLSLMDAVDLAIGASGAQKTQSNCCTICCTIPTRATNSRESFSNFFDLTGRRANGSAMGKLENSGQICRGPGPKNRRPSIEMFTQVPTLRILGVCGEVAERLKAAVC
jgi:hypothetical protein